MSRGHNIFLNAFTAYLCCCVVCLSTNALHAQGITEMSDQGEGSMYSWCHKKDLVCIDTIFRGGGEKLSQCWEEGSAYANGWGRAYAGKYGTCMLRRG